ncbi:extracellular solute-binding protein [Vreelandella arcis]|uniref:Spermidine/putrescine transport system substrate-binding protein n=1 Tax=Vreelandella arcis TaxID=416873 RepID=A0A1G9YRJ7_9GAMM|nr:extracellular solute-binding protein [Halomonas arcis]SDN11702.1 spermidine/putrescine transport system substrate-binding protein [Halomonas arcis]
MHPSCFRYSLTLPATLILTGMGSAQANETLNALVWCDHTDPALIEPFEERHDVSINLREYEGTGAAFAMLEQSRPGDWDVLVIDTVDVPRAVEAGLLAPLDASALPTDDFFPEIVMASSNQMDGNTYAVTEKFGFNTISYNADSVDPADLDNLLSIWGDEPAGRIAIYDYYLPVIGLVATGLGLDTSELTAEDLPAIREELLKMKQAASSTGGVVASQTALATGEAEIVVGGGEWLTAVLAEEQPNLTWTIPEQGAVRWSQSIGVVADSEKSALAEAFVQHLVSPEGQAALATSSCYWGMPANQQTGEHLTEAQKSVLRWDQQEDYLARSQLYPAPDEQLDAAMQDLWFEMLQH